METLHHIQRQQGKRWQKKDSLIQALITITGFHVHKQCTHLHTNKQKGTLCSSNHKMIRQKTRCTASTAFNMIVLKTGSKVVTELTLKQYSLSEQD